MDPRCHPSPPCRRAVHMNVRRPTVQGSPTRLPPVQGSAISCGGWMAGRAGDASPPAVMPAVSLFVCVQRRAGLLVAAIPPELCFLSWWMTSPSRWSLTHSLVSSLADQNTCACVLGTGRTGQQPWHIRRGHIRGQAACAWPGQPGNRLLCCVCKPLCLPKQIPTRIDRAARRHRSSSSSGDRERGAQLIASSQASHRTHRTHEPLQLMEAAGLAARGPPARHHRRRSRRRTAQLDRGGLTYSPVPTDEFGGWRVVTRRDRE